MKKGDTIELEWDGTAYTCPECKSLHNDIIWEPLHDTMYRKNAYIQFPCGLTIYSAPQGASLSSNDRHNTVFQTCTTYTNVSIMDRKKLQQYVIKLLTETA